MYYIYIMTVNRGPRRGYASAYNSSITNKPTCGGDKKVGLIPTVGRGPYGLLSPALNRGYNKIIWPVKCQQAVTGLDAAGNIITRANRKGGWTPTGRMPLSVNPQCSGGVGRRALVPGCDLWRW